MTTVKGTAWGELEFKLGEGPSGVVKEGSYSLEYQEGNTKEWKAIGGRVIDKRQMPGSIRVSYELKGIGTGAFNPVLTGETTLVITPKDKIGEVITFKKGTVSVAPIFTDDGGYGTKVTYNAIAEEDGTLFSVSEGSGGSPA